jgi:nicotinamide mononucleotide transporter
VSGIEITAALLSLIAVLLVMKRSVWNYPFGLAGVALSAQVFYGAKLYSDVLLQFYFFLLQLYGWWNWLQHRDTGGLVIVETLDHRGRWQSLACVLGITMGLGFFMSRYTDAALPWWDASIAGLSVVAQILLSRRKLENWWLWVITNTIAVGVYYAKGLYLFTLLYLLFLVLAVLGWRSWRTQLKSAAT